MAAPTQVETTKLALKEIFDLWDARASCYGDVLYSSALAKPNDGNWRNVLTFFQPLHRSEKSNTELHRDYGDFKISQGRLSLDETKTALKRIVEEGQLFLPRLPDVQLHSFLHSGSGYFWRSDARSYPVHFPFVSYQFTIDQSCRMILPNSAVWTPDLPLYPSIRVAIEDLFYTRLGDDRAYEGVLSALVPDYRGKISGIRLLNNGISVHIVCPEGEDRTALRAKLYCEDSHARRVMKDLEFDQDGAAFVPVESFPRQMVIVLLSKISGDRIDERIFDAQLPFRPSDLIIEEVEQTVENMIRGGESESIEFKSQLPQQKEAIAVTAVAFANQVGGKIFIGVDDNAQIVGFNAEGAKENLTNIFRDRCEPPLPFEIQEVTALGKNIVIVTILEGKDKPYQVKEKGVYVRMQSTNRLATRYELDEIYRLKTGSFGFGAPSPIEY